jgi:anti-anti-sigma regulatory factor
VVVRAAVTAGTSTVDLSGVEFFSAAAVRALFRAADLLQQRGRPLVLMNFTAVHNVAMLPVQSSPWPRTRANGRSVG